MIVSFSNNFLFLHNYKVAGTSIKNALGEFGVIKPPHSIKLVKLLESAKIINNKYVLFALKNMGVSRFSEHEKAYFVRGVWGEDVYDSLYSFGFVRNPWDWLVSLYHFTKSRKNNYNYKLVNSFHDFDEYVAWKCCNDVRKQKDFFYYKNKRIVNYIGKFENIENDFKEICDQISIEKDLPKKNVGNHRHWSEYYNDKTKALVEKAFKDDIDLFEYEYVK